MIGDAEVSRATLNNPGFIETLGIEIGDTVAIVRSGEIIPKILHKVDAWTTFAAHSFKPWQSAAYIQLHHGLGFLAKLLIHSVLKLIQYAPKTPG